jgi:hypothetical protein
MYLEYLQGYYILYNMDNLIISFTDEFRVLLLSVQLIIKTNFSHDVDRCRYDEMSGR